MTDTSKKRCDEIAGLMRQRVVMEFEGTCGVPFPDRNCHYAADLITALQERVAEVERQLASAKLRATAAELLPHAMETAEYVKVRSQLAEAMEVVRRIREARVKYGATGFPVGLYPDPIAWIEDQCDALLAEHGGSK